MPSPPVETRCYVLAPDGRPPGAALVELIDRRGWTVESADDPLATLADVAGLERAESHRSAWGLRRRLDQALVVVPPERAGGFGEIGALIDAVRQYLPDLPAWLYAAGSLSPLTPGGRAREHVNGTATGAPARPVAAEPAPVPATDRPQPTSWPGSGADPEETTASGTLDADELRMLLNREPDEERTDDRDDDRDAGAHAGPEPPPLPSAYAAPGVELRLSAPMAPDDAEPADDDPDREPGDALDDDPDAGPSRITSEEMRMLFESDPEAPARS